MLPPPVLFENIIQKRITILGQFPKMFRLDSGSRSSWYEFGSWHQPPRHGSEGYNCCQKDGIECAEITNACTWLVICALVKCLLDSHFFGFNRYPNSQFLALAEALCRTPVDMIMYWRKMRSMAKATLEELMAKSDHVYSHTVSS